jgi:hypothetical protein
MIIEKEILINKNIDEGWNVLGRDFANASKWASDVNHSEGSGEAFNESSCSERGCSTTMGNIKEKLYEYSNENYTLAYYVAEGMPGIVKHATNKWQLIKVNHNTCTLHIVMEFKPSGILGYVMQPILKMKMNGIGNNLVEDFAYYVENKKPHPRKLKKVKK